MLDIFDANLLPCPFCGGIAEFEYTPWNEETETGDDGTGWVECQSCHVQMTGCDRDDAEQRWNKQRGGENGLLIFEFPKHMEHPAGRVNLTAAYLLEYWANKGAIPRYDGVIDGLLEGAAEIFKGAKPVRSNALAQGREDSERPAGAEG